MKRVTGVGGIFFNAKDPVALRTLVSEAPGHRRTGVGRHRVSLGRRCRQSDCGHDVWSIGGADGDHFAPSTSSFMINYRVADLQALLRALRSEGCNVLEKTDDSTTENSAGSWIRRATRLNFGSLLPGNDASHPDRTPTLRIANRDDIAAMHRVRTAVLENRLTSSVITEQTTFRQSKRPAAAG
jgi:hypothetical protein